MKPLPPTARILLVRTDRLGDLILSTPAIRAVRAAFPNGYVALLVSPATRALVDGHPAVDEVFVLDKDGAHRGWAGTRRLAADLSTRRFDAALLLHTTTRVVLLTWLAGIRCRVGYARRLGWLLTQARPDEKRLGERHELDYTLDLLRTIGIPAEDRRLEIAWSPESQGAVERWLAGQDIAPEDRLVVLHPGASCPSKRWPAARFAEVADRLGTEGIKVAVAVGPGEQLAGAEVRRRANVPVAMPDRPWSLTELSWLLRRAACVISNDSGPVHLAGAAGVPVVAIFGRWGGGLSPTRWGPTGARSAIVHHDVGCRPCLAHRCQIGYLCLQAAPVDEVVAAAWSLMREQSE